MSLYTPTDPEGLLKLALGATRAFHLDHHEAVSAAGLAVAEVHRNYPPEDRSRVIGQAARRKVIDVLRAERGRRGQKPHTAYLEDHPYREPSETPHERTLDRLAAQEDVHRLVERLSDRERLIVDRLAAGETLAEVGERLGVTESRVCQVRGRLRERLEDPR